MSTNPIELPLSVIIPNYNNATDNLLEISINSIFNNLYIPNECIIIDDCSTDNSLEFLNRISSKIPQISIIKNDQNIGALESRKKGILTARNDYIVIIDGDDFIEENTLNAAYQILKNDKSDIVTFTPYQTDYDGKNAVEMLKIDTTSFPVTGKEACARTLGKWEIAAWMISKKDIYLKAYTGFSPSQFNADELLSRLVFMNAKRVSITDKKYFYRNNKNSVTQKKSLRHLDVLKSQLWLITFAQKNNFNLTIQRELKRNFLKSSRNILREHMFYAEGMGTKAFLEQVSKDILSFQHLDKSTFIQTLSDTSTLMRIIKLHILYIYIKFKLKFNKGNKT